MTVILFHYTGTISTLVVTSFGLQQMSVIPRVCYFMMVMVTTACRQHRRIDTQQQELEVLNKTARLIDLGPWGDMRALNSRIPYHMLFDDDGAIDAPVSFYNSIYYDGAQFRDLEWDGGIGLTSETDMIEEGSTHFITMMYSNGVLKNPRFSMISSRSTRSGYIYFGDDDASVCVHDTEVELRRKVVPSGICGWSTLLHSVSMGSRIIAIKDTFVLDTGSSEFKGNSTIILPILKVLMAVTDGHAPVFEPILDHDKNIIGLLYLKPYTPALFGDRLPKMSIVIGQSCNATSGRAANITISAIDYSYYATRGDYANRWIVGFSVMQGLDFMLSGSLFLDHFCSSYQHVVASFNKLSQGPMYLYAKRSSYDPTESARMECVNVS